MIADAIYRSRLRSHPDKKIMFLMLGFSLILHASLVGIATVEFGLTRGKQSLAPVYSVELVTLQAAEQKGQLFPSGRKTLTRRARQAIPIQRFRAKEQPLSLKKRKRAQLPGERTEEVQPPEEILAKIERPSPLKGAPAPAQKAEKAVTKPVVGRKSVSLMQVGSMKGGELSQALMLYRALVNEKIESNWVLPERFSESQDKLEAVVVVRTRRDGTVYDLHFEKKSGDPYFDDSVLKAILKSKPFPPFPDIYSPKEEEIVIHFAPENVRP